MPIESSFPSIDIPNVDLWGLMFQRRRREFPNDKVIYRDAITERYYTYGEVEKAATTFGEGLRSLWDWEKGDVLNIYAPNNIDIPPVIYGTFYAGGIVSPTNPGYTVDELVFQLQDSGAKAIATMKEVLHTAIVAAEKVGIPQDRIILLGDEKDEGYVFKHFTSIVKAGIDHFRRRKIKPDEDLSFLVYSSGTTGLPKGVMLTHRNIVADLLMITGAVGRHYSWANDKMLGVLPFYHIYGLVGLVHQSLYRGIEVVVVPRFELDLFCRTIQNHRLTFVYVAPPVLVVLSRDPRVDNYDLKSVKMITSGAAPLTRELVDSVYKRLKIKINQAYGLSETSPMTHTQVCIAVVFRTLNPDLIPPAMGGMYSTVGSVGKMFPNLSAMYVSPEGKEQPPGTPGELWLRGPNVFKGYWKNPEATKSSVTSDGFFKTGDVGYQDEGHNFFITDRVKELIKYKGYQVAPAELEGLLMLHPKINDVAVVGVALEAEHTEVPRAYVVPAPGVERNNSTAQKILDWQAGQIASHKRLRGGMLFVGEIPESAAGKILRRLLKDKMVGEMKKVKAKL